MERPINSTARCTSNPSHALPHCHQPSQKQTNKQKAAIFQLDYFLGLFFHIDIYSPLSSLHKKVVRITVLLLQKGKVRLLIVSKFAQGYLAIKDRTIILSQVYYLRGSIIYPIPYSYKIDLPSSNFDFFLLCYTTALYLKE